MPTFWLMHDARLRIVLGKLLPEEWSLLFAGEEVLLLSRTVSIGVLGEYESLSRIPAGADGIGKGR
jgi:hypothetical protein